MYIGSTLDFEKRLEEHNSGKVRSTKGRRPFRLIHKEECDTITQARRRENFLKTGHGRQWLKECVNNKERWPSSV
jgi:putative endonuclease